ncbi:MAG TPA: hypothetical protein VNV66_22055 [Pilimelia sp.]|nr:hypothetical protein [Pilimelia sp.]
MTLRQVHLPGGASGPVGRGGHSTLGLTATVENRTTGVLAVPEQHPHAELVRIRYDLTAKPPATVSATANWTNPNNAAGARDGAVATLSGALAARSDTLTLTYPAQTGRGSLTIVSARVDFYVQLRGSLLGSGRMRLRLDAVPHLDTTTNVNHLTAPFTVDLPAFTWAALPQPSVIADTTAASTAAVDVDAVELVVTAFREDTL